VNPVRDFMRSTTKLRVLDAPANQDVSAQPGGGVDHPMRGRRFHRVLYIAVATLILLSIAAWQFMQPPSVATALATRGAAIDVVYATGVVEHLRQARLASVVSAPIRHVYVSEGQHVNANAPLAQLEDGPARGLAEQLAAQATMARLTAERVQAIYDEGFSSRSAWDEARGRRDAAQAAANAARSQLRYYTIAAPFAGVVMRRDAEPGDLASSSQVLFVVADESSLRITTDLDERDIARVAVGQNALIRADAYPDRDFEATVTDITPQGDAATRVFRVRLGLPPNTQLRAGMTVETNIVTGERQNAVLAPAAAVKGSAVWVVSEGRALRRTIVRGATGGDLVEIQQGLDVGDEVILEPPASLRDGARVRLRPNP
jgi:RND family efflux transporter MFP subunit